MRLNVDYIKFPDILALAHDEGIQDIKTDPVQLPSEENGWVAVFKATVIAQSGQTFEAHGDASDETISAKEIKPAKIRMAESRAIARALRWYTNSGKVVDAELPDYDEENAPAAANGQAKSQAAQQGVSAEFLQKFHKKVALCTDRLDPDQVAIILAGFELDSIAATPLCKDTMREVGTKLFEAMPVESQIEVDALFPKSTNGAAIEGGVK